MTVSNRIVAAIRGAFIADAASMGTHWIYDPAEMATSVSSVSAPEFKDPPTPKYYSATEFPGHYHKNGMLSPYGEQLLFVTEYTAGNGSGIFSGQDMSLAMLEWAETFGGRPDHALTQFVENMKLDDKAKGGQWPNCGADDDQAHIYMKVVPVTCRYAGSTQLVDKVSQAIQVHQNNKKAMAFGVVSARILEAVLLGAPSLKVALSTVELNMKDDLETYYPEQKQDVLDAFAYGKERGLDNTKTMDDVLLEWSHVVMKGKEDTPFYNMAGRSCALPGSFIGPIAIFYKSSTLDDGTSSYVSAIRENILAAGDTCSRAVFIGAVLAASGGTIPSDWVENMDNDTLKKVDTAIEAITSSVTAAVSTSEE